MYDHPMFLKTLSKFARILPAPYELEIAMSELTASVTAVLGLCGCGVTMAHGGRLRFVTTMTDASAELERVHEQHHPCPCRDAYATGEEVRVTDMREQSERWPEFSASAARIGVVGVAAIPMRLDDQIIGTLNLYSTGPRQWSDRDIAAAWVLADMATSYVVNASTVRQQEQFSEQVPEARESQLIIEQAKGIIAQQHSSTVDQAAQHMRRHAHNNNASLRAVADAIIAVGLRV